MIENTLRRCFVAAALPVVAWVVCLMPLAVFAESSSLDTLPTTLARIKPSIVAIGTYLPTRRPDAVFHGTGFVVGDGRYALTNLHVLPKNLNVAKNESLAVLVPGGNRTAIRLAVKTAEDVEHDVVLLKFSDAPLPAMSLGDSDAVREGKLYAFTGFPLGGVLGLYPVTHRGIVSSITPIAVPAASANHLTPDMMRFLAAPFNVFQLDAIAYPGNSGSPLYDPVTGKVVGIINKVLVQEGKESELSHPSGISFAIPIRYARALLTKAGL